MSDYEVNAVATLIGFSERLTCKVGRKTAGSIFFAHFKDIGAVSRMMGHSSISITERYYLKTTGYTVDLAMHAQRQDSRYTNFVYINQSIFK